MRRFEVIFDGAAIGQIEVEVQPWDVKNEAPARCLARLGLSPCWGSNPHERCPASDGLHGHIPPVLFDAQNPIRRGDRTYYVAHLGDVGEISYSFDATHPIAPPVTFSEVTT